jgi:hypothetical protein
LWQALSINLNHSHSVEDGTTALLDEPLLGFSLGDTLELANAARSVAPCANTLAGSAEDDVEVHTEDTSGGVVLDAEVDVFVDTKAEVA